MKVFKTLLKTELKLSLRGMDMFIFAICMPVLVTVILGFIYGDKTTFPNADFTFLEQSFAAISTPMLILSGATLPYEVMPTALQRVSDIFPLTQGIKLLKSTAVNLSINDSVIPICIEIIILTVVCTTVSFKFFKWE